MPWHEPRPAPRLHRLWRGLRDSGVAGAAALLLFLLGVGGLGAGWRGLFWIPPVLIGAIGLIAASARQGGDNWP